MALGNYGIRDIFRRDFRRAEKIISEKAINMEKEAPKQKTPEELLEERTRKELLQLFKSCGYNVRDVQPKGGLLDEWLSPKLRPLVEKMVNSDVVGDIVSHFFNCRINSVVCQKIEDLFLGKDNCLASQTFCSVFYLDRNFQGCRQYELIATRHSPKSKTVKLLARLRDRGGFFVEFNTTVSVEAPIFLGMATTAALDHDLRQWPIDTLICYLGKGAVRGIGNSSMPEGDLMNYLKGTSTESVINRLRSANVQPGKKQLIKIKRNREEAEKAFNNLREE